MHHHSWRIVEREYVPSELAALIRLGAHAKNLNIEQLEGYHLITYRCQKCLSEKVEKVA